MSTREHEGSRPERYETVSNIPENQWDFDVLKDLLRGLWDHGYQVNSAAEEKLLNLAINPDIKPILIHPIDLALKYIGPGTYDNTFKMVRKMKEIGLPAKKICLNFFKKLQGHSKRKIFESYEIIKGSELEKFVEPIFKELTGQFANGSEKPTA